MNVWVPKQYGAWAMLLAPVLAGSIIGGFGWHEILILVSWVAAYLSYMAIRGISGRDGRAHIAPATVFGVVAAAGAVTLLVWHPALIWWAVPLIVLFGTSLALIISGRERSAVNDAAQIGASCVMTAAAATAHLMGAGFGWAVFAAGVDSPKAWLAAAIFAGYFWGTIPYVKTMIRERGKLSWYIASIAYHAVMIVLGFLVNPWVGAFAVLATARAALVPKLWPRAKPKRIGIGEMVGTVILIVIVVCTL